MKGLKNKLKYLLINGSQTSEIKNVYEEIKLVRNISTIQNDTLTIFKEVIKLIENYCGNPKKDTIDLLNNLLNFATEYVSQAEFKNGIEDRIKCLEKTLKTLKII